MTMSYEEKTDRIKPHLTPEFLTSLAEVARIYGWDADYEELGRFVEAMFRMADVTPPDLNPYGYDDE
ncbi:MAG: hypothetical protein J7556_15185 [Acidovorax sp.]|nr:hypothetical protein [Acidovorax sp.]